MPSIASGCGYVFERYLKCRLFCLLVKGEIFAVEC
jgi:hypothetical protein